MGQAVIAAKVARTVGSEIPPRAADFLAEQPMVVMASTDASGQPWCGLVVGPRGFARATDPATISIDGLPADGDPLADILASPRLIGLISLEPESRRRMRVNGTSVPTASGVRIQVSQVFSNCPKYISRRHVTAVRAHAGRPDARRAPTLNEQQTRMIATADTFFVGSADEEGNADASHRGGNPGFVEVLSHERLRWPDYRGNSMFMTLGNIAVNPRCALLFIDWTSGTTLQVAGNAEITWDEEPAVAGAQCTIDFTVTEVVEIKHASPLLWTVPELSPVNPR